MGFVWNHLAETMHGMVLIHFSSMDTMVVDISGSVWWPELFVITQHVT